MIEVKKGDTIIVKGFTGIKLGVFKVDSATKKTLTVLKRNGDEMIFDRKTGKQINVEEGKEKYANSVMEDDGSFVAPTRGKKKQEAPKKATKKAKPEPEEEIDDDEDNDEEPVKPVKPAKKSASKKAPVKKTAEEDDEEEDDDFEEIDD